MNKKITIIIILLLFSSKFIFSQKNNSENTLQQKVIIAKFIKAEVLEGAGTYTFKDSKGNAIYFVFDDYYNQKIPYHFFGKEALMNENLINTTFKISYITKSEIRGESEEQILVNRIVKIKRIKK